MEQTFGQKLVGIAFNPSGLDAVGATKQKFAEVIDGLHEQLQKTTDQVEQTLLNEAIGHALTAQMWVVKAITYKP